MMLLETQSELQTLDDLQKNLEDQRELAQNRMAELDKLKMKLSTLPEYVMMETTKQRSIQTHFWSIENSLRLPT
jgi:hypothetical protein